MDVNKVFVFKSTDAPPPPPEKKKKTTEPE